MNNDSSQKVRKNMNNSCKDQTLSLSMVLHYESNSVLRGKKLIITLIRYLIDNWYIRLIGKYTRIKLSTSFIHAYIVIHTVCT